MTIVIQIFGSLLLASVPAIIWWNIFRQKHSQDKFISASVFCVGALAVLPILIYRLLWNYFPWINAFRYTQLFENHIVSIYSVISIPLSVILTFMVVGVIEELMKNLTVRTVDHKYFKNIDDVIELSIVAALGFSFTENILYFQNIWHVRGAEELLKPFLFRSVFSTFAHIMFSGIFGYYFGVAVFAKGILQRELVQKRSFFLRALHKVFKFRTAEIFYNEKILEGLIVSSVLHAFFNILLELDLTYYTVPLLIAGYVVLNYLIHKKENHIRYNLLLKKAPLTEHARPFLISPKLLKDAKLHGLENK